MGRHHRDEQRLSVVEEKKKKSGEKKEKKRKKKNVAYGAFGPVFWPGHMTTPKTTAPYTGNQTPSSPPPPASGPGPNPSPGGGGPGPAPMGASWMPASKDRVLYEMKRCMGLLVEFGDGGGSSSFQGFNITNPLAATKRVGGPQISGPGFQDGPDPNPGVYSPRTSPGISFSTDKGWSIWRAALDIMERDKTLPPNAIVQAAIAKAGMRIGDLSSPELRLIEMGIEWYQGGVGTDAAKRDSGGGPGY